jgi:S-methylmethionine-dependent homocysteine/selenocysteine methylase
VTRTTLLDGGTGRELLRIGAPFSQPLWSAQALIEAPQYVSRVHENFIAAGAEVITTNTYALVPFHLGEARFRARGHELAALAGRLAREAADRAPRQVLVAGGLPPACGSYRPDLFDAAVARPILATLVDAMRPSVDLWLAETISLIAEAELVREVVGPAVGQGAKPLWLSFTIADEAAGEQPVRLRSGEHVAEAVAAAVRLGAAAVLFNCSQPEVMGAAVSEALAELRRRGTAEAIPVGVYANAFAAGDDAVGANEGLRDLRGEITPEAYLAWARDWVARGARIIGGCCGIGPQHLAALRAGLAPVSRP